MPTHGSLQDNLIVKPFFLDSNSYYIVDYALFRAVRKTFRFSSHSLCNIMKRNIILLAVSVFCGISLSSCNGLVDPALLEALSDGGTIYDAGGDYSVASEFVDYATGNEYDSSGIPVFGYDGGQAVYGYAEDNTPIYDYSDLTATSTVPSWSPQNSSVSYPRVGRRSSNPPRNAHNRHGSLKHRSKNHGNRHGGHNSSRNDSPRQGGHRGINLDAPANRGGHTPGFGGHKGGNLFGGKHGNKGGDADSSAETRGGHKGGNLFGGKHGQKGDKADSSAKKVNPFFPKRKKA